MNSILREYLAKGLFLGLWAYLALVHPDWSAVGRVLAWTVGGLAVGFLGGAIQQFLRGYRPGRNLGGFLLLVLLDSPYFLYAGIIGGLGLGVVLETEPQTGDQLAAAIGGLTAVTPGGISRDWLGYCTLAGVVLGYGFAQLRAVKQPFQRFVLGAIIGATLIFLAVSYLGKLPDFAASAENQRLFGTILLLGLPFFYLLTFCGEAEESEVEIAALCAGLGIGLYLLRLSSLASEYTDKLILLAPLILYFVYVTRVMPGLNVFKHTLRGYGNLSLGRVRESITSFGRALELDRKNDLATKGLFQLHRRIDVSKLDPETIRLLNFDFCLQVARTYLVGETAPTEKDRTEAIRLLELVERYQPARRPTVDYLNAVAYCHAKDFDLAAGYLAQLLNPETPYPEGNGREGILFDAWALALRHHPRMVERLGERHLSEPGRRIEAIRAVERQLTKTPDDPTANDLRRSLYTSLTETEFVSACGSGPPQEFNYDFIEQIGLSLVEDADPARAERGAGFLRIAGRGLPARGPMIFTRLAEDAAKRGDSDAVRGYLEQVKRAGVTVGANRLPAEAKPLYINALKRLVEDSEKRNELETAVGDYRLLIEATKEDANSLRKLAELEAKTGDLMNAILAVETGLLYSKADADLLGKKDSYYYSVTVERVTEVKDKIARWFDVAYCIRKAKAVADQKEPDLDTLDYGLHMVKLARVIEPARHSAIVVEARILLRKGERDAAISLLEDVREQPRGSGEEAEDAWYLATRLLADLYLNELDRADLAVAAYTDYREYQKSGAETMYQLGIAYEKLNKVQAAIQAYEGVTVYTQHPRYYDATEAVRRLKGQ